MGYCTCFWKEALDRASHLGEHMGPAVLSEEEKMWCRAARGADSVLGNHELSLDIRC